MGTAACCTNTGTDDQRADPLPRSITLEIPQGLLASLRDLTIGIGGDDQAVAESLRALMGELDNAVTSYRGLQLTIMSNGFPVVLTAFDDGYKGAVVTSLRVPLALVDSGFAAESRVVFYASTSGAFVDLAADLAFVLGTTSSSAGVAEDLASPIRLDADAPPSSSYHFDLSGVTELATIDRAVGVLIGQGHHPDDAYQTLHSDAARAGLDPYAWAARLLQRVRSRRLE